LGAGENKESWQVKANKLEENGLTEAASRDHVLAILCQSTNELVSPDNFRF
jgi:hypothetical protein